MPLDFHGVPQQRPPTPSGRRRAIPAFAARDSNAVATPGPPSAGPNIVPTHAWKYTADTAPAADPARPGLRWPPPWGRSFDHSGSVSWPSTPRAALLGISTSGAGIEDAMVSAVDAIRVVAPQALPAVVQRALSAAPTVSDRSLR